MKVTFTIPAKYRSYVEGRMTDIRDECLKNEERLAQSSEGRIPAFALDKGEGSVKVTVQID